MSKKMTGRLLLATQSYFRTFEMNTEDFLESLIRITMWNKPRPLILWQLRLPPGRIDYRLRMKKGRKVLFVTVGTDQHLENPTLRVQLVGAPNERGVDVIATYDLDVGCSDRAAANFEVLRQSIASRFNSVVQFRHDDVVPIKNELGAAELEVYDGYLKRRGVKLYGPGWTPETDPD